MSGFNPAELLPFYLDETDEHIAALNDALLRLEQEPADAKALAEAFRMFHSIKGSSVVMGFDSVKELTHHLESLFDQFRSKKRDLDRPVLDLTFRCLDELRDYHRDLRAEGAGKADLAALVPLVVAALDPAWIPAPTALKSEEPAKTPEPEPAPAPMVDLADDSERVAVTVVFEPNLPLADMKARLVLNRLATRGTILETKPPAEQLDEAEALAEFTVWLATNCSSDELRSLADVDGVARIRIDAEAALPSEGALPADEAVAPSSQPSPTVGEGGDGAASALQEASGKPIAGAPNDPLQLPLGKGESPISVPPLPRGNSGGASGADTQAAPAPATPKKKVAETIRVESDRLDYLMNLAGELVINKARFVDIAKGLDELFRGSNAQALAADTEDRLESLTRGLDGLGSAGAGDGALDRWAGHVRRLRDNVKEIHGELDRLRQGRETLKALTDAIHSLGRVTDGLQKGVLDTRMVPIGPLFERFRRVIRDLSHSSGKEVLLVIGGEKTELDKRMIDELSDPLIHMVRNSVDHGLESPDAREAAGKPRAGTVTLQATHRGNSVVITVSDDGRGIDCERIRKKIVARGLVSQADAAGLSDRELIAYIWHPGLSTAETVTDISGRGVGMDIVKNRIENLSGTVDVRSTPGQGTVFTIRLPLTLAIMSSLLVQVFDEVYALPLDHIDEIVEVKSPRVFRVQGRPTIEVRKRIIALVFVKDLFRWAGGPHPLEKCEASEAGNGNGGGSQAEALRVVVVQNGETTIGLVVDRLIGMQEVVLKSLEKNFRSVPGLSGASILGDGRVSLILDVDAVIGMAASRAVAREPARAGA